MVSVGGGKEKDLMRVIMVGFIQKGSFSEEATWSWDGRTDELGEGVQTWWWNDKEKEGTACVKSLGWEKLSSVKSKEMSSMAQV